MVGSADGKHLYVTDADAQRIAMINTQRLDVETTATLTLPSPGNDDSAFASIAPDGILYVSGGPQLSAISIDSMTAGPTWEADSPILGTRVSEDGMILYVAIGDGIQGRDPRTGAPLGAIRLPGATELLDESGP
jgi:sugar lactone lactonase YvrE